MWTTDHRNEGCARRAFTLVETVAVILLIAVMAFAIFSRGSTGREKVLLEAACLRSHLRFAQSRAMADTVASWEVRITPGSGASYTLYRDGAVAPLDLPGEGSATHRLPSGLSLQIVTGGTAIGFDDRGSAGSADCVLVVSGRRHSQTVRIIRNTGFIP